MGPPATTSSPLLHVTVTGRSGMDPGLRSQSEPGTCSANATLGAFTLSTQRLRVVHLRATWVSLSAPMAAALTSAHSRWRRTPARLARLVTSSAAAPTSVAQSPTGAAAGAVAWPCHWTAPAYRPLPAILLVAIRSGRHQILPRGQREGSQCLTNGLKEQLTGPPQRPCLRQLHLASRPGPKAGTPWSRTPPSPYRRVPLRRPPFPSGTAALNGTQRFTWTADPPPPDMSCASSATAACTRPLFNVADSFVGGGSGNFAWI